jgi:hypothetical protein
VVLLLRAIKGYYAKLDAQRADDGVLQLRNAAPPIVVVMIEEWNRPTEHALQLAMQLSPEVIAIHLRGTTETPGDRAEDTDLQRHWYDKVVQPLAESGRAPPELRCLETPYRRMQAPLLKLMEALAREHHDRTFAVLIPHIIKQHWWQHLLHTHRAQRLRSSLLRYSGSPIVVIDMPWRLTAPRVEQVLTREEIAASSTPAASTS